MHVLNTSRA